MRALIVAPQPFFTPRGTPLSVYYRTLAMAELGVEADVLTYGEGEDVRIEGVRLIRIPRLRMLEPVKVGPSAAKAVLDLLLTLQLVWLLIRRRYDFVAAHEEAIFICRFLQPIFRFKLVYEMHSSLPRQLGSFGFTDSRLVIGLFEWLEMSSLRAADAVVTICPSLASYALSLMPDASKHFLIENSILDEVKLIQSDEPASEVKTAERPLPRDRTIVAYAGTFEPYQGLEILIAALAEIRKHRPEVFLLLVGGSSEQVGRCRQLAVDLGLEQHCLFTGRVDQSTARKLVGAAAVVTSPRLAGSNTPLKVYEQLASGVPLVATRIEAHTQILNEEVCWLSEPEPAAFAHAILDALRNPAEARRRAAAARDLYGRKYSRQVYMGKVRCLLESLG